MTFSNLALYTSMNEMCKWTETLKVGVDTSSNLGIMMHEDV